MSLWDGPTWGPTSNDARVITVTEHLVSKATVPGSRQFQSHPSGLQSPDIQHDICAGGTSVTARGELWQIHGIFGWEVSCKEA